MRLAVVILSFFFLVNIPRFGIAEDVPARNKYSTIIGYSEIDGIKKLPTLAECLAQVEKTHDSAAHCNLARAYYVARELTKAIEASREAVRLDARNAEAHDLLGMYLFAKGLSKDALPEVQEAVRLESNNAEYIHDLATVLLSNRRMNEAIVELRRELSIRPQHITSINDLAVAYCAIGEFEKALDEANRSLSIKENANARKVRMFVEMRTSQIAAAIEDCNFLLSVDPNAMDVLSNRAQARIWLNDAEGAERDARVMLTSTDVRDRALGYQKLGSAYLVRKEEATALEQFDKSLALFPNDPTSRVLRAVSYRALSNFAAAVTDLDDVIKMYDEPQKLNSELKGCAWQVYKFRAMIHIIHQPDYKAADLDLTKAIELNPKDSADCYALRGWSHWMQDDYAAAIADFEQSLKANPEHGLATFGLTTLLTTANDDRLRNGKRALDIATKACERTTDSDPLFIQAQAAAYSEIGDFEHATASQQKLLDNFSQATVTAGYDVYFWWGWKDTFTFTYKREGLEKIMTQYQAGTPYHTATNPLNLPAKGLIILK